jgi:hypothetical protein
MIVGATQKGLIKLNRDGSCCDHRGKVYAFEKVEGVWVQDGEPLQPDYESTYQGFQFGAYIALDGDTALIGHACDIWGSLWDWETQQSIRVDQTVHVFARTEGDWEQTRKLTPSDVGQDPNTWNGFGRGVELRGNRALIWSDWNNAMLLENWQYVKTENIVFGISASACQRCGMIALSADAIFFGANPTDATTAFYQNTGAVFVTDNHSILPVSDALNIDLDSTFDGFFSSPFIEI